jgi:hypothetical protein
MLRHRAIHLDAAALHRDNADTHPPGFTSAGVITAGVALPFAGKVPAIEAPLCQER